MKLRLDPMHEHTNLVGPVRVTTRSLLPVVFLGVTITLSVCWAQQTTDAGSIAMQSSIGGGVSNSAVDPSRLVKLRGKRVYVEVSGPSDAPALLYLHGGPGAGAYDFGLYQGEQLSRSLRLVMMDQRGVLRSDPLRKGEALRLEDLIEDCEMLRKHLNIESWSVLGHSFGGYLAVTYALDYPKSVTRLILESPTLDLASSARSLLQGAAIEYRKLGKTEEAEACLKAAADAKLPEVVWKDFSRLTRGLGAARNNLYVHGPDKDFFDQLISQGPIPKEWWSRQNEFQRSLYGEKRVFESLIPKLSDIMCPTLLIKGKYDWVTSDDQVDALRQRIRLGRTVVFEQSSHFPRVEEPARYAQAVIEFCEE